jgi:hypothetical protein
MQSAELTTGFLLFIVSLVIYVLPGIYAYTQRHRNRQLIFFVNLIFGWTVIGWIICAVWASGKDIEEPKIPVEQTHRKCPDCAELILKEARVCKHCGCKSLEPC